MIDTNAPPTHAESMGTVKDTPPEKTQVIHVRVDLELRHQIELFARDHNISESSAIRTLIQTGLAAKTPLDSDTFEMMELWASLSPSMRAAIKVIAKNKE